MKRNRIWGLGLALTLVLGCWAGSASARPLEATGSLLVPYYEVQSNLATLIGVQHVGAQTAGVSIINVAVHDADGGVVAGGYICLAPNEFGYVVLQNAQPPLDEDFGIYFSVARDAIARTGFVGLAFAGTRNSCSDGAGAVATASENVMVAWAVLQDVGSGFFATEVPVLQVGWEAGQTAGSPARDLEPYCYANIDPTRQPVYDQFTTNNTACNANYTFVASGPYCYLNTDQNRARVDAQLNDAGTGCDDEFTHTFVPANRTLPAIPAAGPRADVSCDSVGECPGLLYNASDEAADAKEMIGARFDVASFNRSVSNIYLWLDTAPLDGRETTFSAICEDGMEKEREITINDHVTVINPAGMGCSGRGVLELTLPERAGDDPLPATTTPEATDLCYANGDATMTAVPEALDDLNNKCRSFGFTRDLNADGTSDDSGCYDAGIRYVFTRDCDNNGTSNDPGCIQRGTTTRVEEAEIGTPVTSCRSRSTTRVTAVESPDSTTPTGCNRYTYKKAVTADSPSGYIFSHIKQANDHFRTSFPGYSK